MTMMMMMMTVIIIIIPNEKNKRNPFSIALTEKKIT
jgi:hypothetical protein